MKALAPDDKVKGKGRRSYRQTVQSLLLIIIIIKVGYQIVKIWAFLFSPVTAQKKKSLWPSAAFLYCPLLVFLIWLNSSGVLFNMLLGLLRHLIWQCLHTPLPKKIFFFKNIFHIFTTTNICHLQSRTYQKLIFTCTTCIPNYYLYLCLTCVHIYIYIWLFSKSRLLDIYKDSLLLQINYAL